MNLKVFTGAIAAILMLLFLSPIIIKLKNIALIGVVLIGVGMMLYELKENITSKDD